MQRVTSLEPRTPHQPEKLQKLSKNEFVCTLFIFRVNKKSALLSAAESIECMPSTGGCRMDCAICQENLGVFLWQPRFKMLLARHRSRHRKILPTKHAFHRLCKSRQEACCKPTLPDVLGVLRG